MDEYPYSMDIMCTCGHPFGHHTDDGLRDGPALYPKYNSNCDKFTEVLLATEEEFWKEFHN